LSQPNPNDSTTGNNQNTVELDPIKQQTGDSDNVFTPLEEENYSVEVSGSQLKSMTITEIAQLWEIDASSLLKTLKENLLLENNYTVNSTINELRAEIRFSPSLVKMVAEGLRIPNNTQGKDESLSQVNIQAINQEIQEEYTTSNTLLPDYNLPDIGLITLLLYLGSKWVTGRLKIRSAKEKKFWNLFLLISFIGSAATGFILIFIRDYDWFRSLNFNFLFWHVEFSIAMGLIGIFHTLWHTKYYLKIFTR